MSLTRLLMPSALCLCGLLFFCQTADARPEMASKVAQDRFAAMDASRDGKVDRDEFFKAQPEMKEAAFTAIDKDGDGFISAEEWAAFASGHGGMPPQGEEASQSPDAPQDRPEGQAPHAPELIMPPKKAD